MTVKLSDYGTHGPWHYTVCESCGKKRSCIGGRVSEDEWFYFCVPCLVKDIERYEKAMEEVES